MLPYPDTKSNRKHRLLSGMRVISTAGLNPAHFLRVILLKVLLTPFVSSLFLATIANCGETNLFRDPPGQARHFSNPQQMAVEHERAGRRREAAALYETIARTNAAARQVLSHRLVTIYTETGQTNKALFWAREVMRNNPDPQAYLAAVHARLGQWKQAGEILQREISETTNTIRAVTLRWQLAEVYAQQGDRGKANKVLNDSVNLAKGTRIEAAARRRLKAFKKETK